MKTIPFFRSVLAVTFLTLLAVGCAKQPGNDAAYQQGSDNCSSEFVSDYNTVFINLNSAYTLEDLHNSISLVDDFKEKYDGVVCDAEFTSDDQLEPRQKQVDANEIGDEWKSAIDAVLTQSKNLTYSSYARQTLAETPSVPAPTEAN